LGQSYRNIVREGLGEIVCNDESGRREVFSAASEDVRQEIDREGSAAMWIYNKAF
jgi:hypothetical protein